MTATLGFDVAAWLQTHLPDPSDHRNPLTLTTGQIDFLAQWFELDGGSFVYRRGALQQSKAWGKSPLAAMLAIAELAGPTTAAGESWNDPLVQIAALSEDQADSTVFSLARSLLIANDGRAASALGIDVGLTRMYLHGRPGKLEAVTTRAGSREGQRVTSATIDESHLMTKRNGGLALARTIRRNAAKMGGRTLETSNAPEIGLGSVAEATLTDHAAGHAGLLVVRRAPSRTPEPTDTDAQVLAALRECYADAPWVDVERILAEIRDPATPWDESLRYYLNVAAGGADMLVEPSDWAALRAPGDIPDGSRVGVGFDGSHSHDGTAVVICDEAGRLSLELLIERGADDPPGWTVPRGLVRDVMADLFGRFDVARLFADPWGWRDELDEWADQYGAVIVLPHPTNSIRRFGPSVDRFRAAMAEGRISHDGDADLARHVANARLLRGPGRAADDGHALYTLEKAGPGRLIDAAVAAINAYEAMATAPAAAEPPGETLAAWA